MLGSFHVYVPCLFLIPTFFECQRLFIIIMSSKGPFWVLNSFFLFLVFTISFFTWPVQYAPMIIIWTIHVWVLKPIVNNKYFLTFLNSICYYWFPHNASVFKTSLQLAQVLSMEIKTKTWLQCRSQVLVFISFTHTETIWNESNTLNLWIFRNNGDCYL